MAEDVKSLRARRVADTEARLVAAASELFVEQGYVQTTLAQVAERAGTATRTVYVRFGTKAALFRRAVDVALVGDLERVDVRRRPGAQTALTAATLGRRIDALVDVTTGIYARAGALFEVAAQAEGGEPEVAAAFQAGRRATVALSRAFWTQAVADRLVDARADVPALTATTDLLICADSVVHLRRTQSWSPDEYRDHLARTLRGLARHPPRRRRVRAETGS